MGKIRKRKGGSLDRRIEQDAASVNLSLNAPQGKKEGKLLENWLVKDGVRGRKNRKKEATWEPGTSFTGV